jgi:serine/threonine protein kinase
MAELFLARTHGPEGFEKLVVLKKILPNFAESPKFVRLFLDEARLAATLDHPHIAHVYDMGTVDGNYFFTMEYIHGQDLRALLRRTHRLNQMLPVDHAVQIVHATASALHYAHERRKPDGSSLEIVHRDVSPSNVLISYDGAIKLVDFGVAKAANSSVKTRTGTLKGKIAYMSPEQAKGGAVDRRSDVFSLGIVMWETLTTQRLFHGDNDLATIQLIVNHKPQPPSELRPEISPELERIVLKTLEGDPGKRYQTAEELQLDLEELAREQKLKQSSIALRAHMQDLFADEIRLWKAAQASGVTLTDHVVSASVVEMTTPVSESEASFMDDDEEEDESIQPPTQGSITETRGGKPDEIEQTIKLQPNVVVGRVDQTPAPHIPMPMPVARTGPHRISTPPAVPIVVPNTPSGRVNMPTPAQPMMRAQSQDELATQRQLIQSGQFPREQTGFPIAPREWHKTGVQQDASEPRRRKMIMAGLIGVAVIAVIALATGGNEPANPAPAAVVAPTPADPIDMKVEPAAVTTVPAPVPVEVNPTVTPAPVVAAPPITHPPVATHPTKTPSTPAKHPPTPTTKPVDPKSHPKDVNPQPGRYDPNSALPPP